MTRIPHSEHIPRRDGEAFSVFSGTYQRFAFTWHQHPEIELVLIPHGQGFRHVGGGVETFRAGDCCLIGSNVPHSWVTEATDGCVSSVVVQFPATLLTSLSAREWGSLVRLPDLCAGGLQLVGDLAERVARELPRITEQRPGPLRLAGLLTILARITEASESTRQLSLPMQSVTAHEGDVWFSLRSYVLSHHQQQLTQAWASKRFGMTPACFARAFRRRFGTTFTAHVQGLRLASAARMLGEHERTVLDIALQVGFCNPSHFNNVFRTAFGCTPREFRKRASADA